MQVFTSLHTDNYASTPPLSFLQAGVKSTEAHFIFHRDHNLKLQSKIRVGDNSLKPRFRPIVPFYLQMQEKKIKIFSDFID